MHFMMYSSRSLIAEEEFEAEFRLICKTAGPKNKILDITGILIHHEGWFIQLLEGPKTNVATLIQVIEQDPRHDHVEILFDFPVAERGFPDWTMGRMNLDQSVNIDQELLDNFSRIYRRVSRVSPRELFDMMHVFLENANSV